MSDESIDHFDKTNGLPKADSIFVFGSNLGGHHGAGAALVAHYERQFPKGLGSGYHNRCYAIPTKDERIVTLHGSIVHLYVEQFKEFARMIEQYDKTGLMQFQVTRVGCGLAGFKDADIAQMFKGSSNRCYFDTKWKPHLGSLYNYWGTF